MIERPRRLRPRPGIAARKRPGPLGRADQRLLVWMRTRGHTPSSERVAGALGTFGEWGLGWLSLGLLCGSADRGRRASWTSAAAVAPSAIAINYAVKLAVGRERPLLEDHPRLGWAPSKLSFPSAHSTSSVAAAVAMGRLAPRARSGLYALAGGVCASRPFLGMHYPSDVAAGVALGVALGAAWPLPGQRRGEVWAK